MRKKSIVFIRISILCIIITFFLVGCAQKERHETRAPVSSSNLETTMERLDPKEPIEIAIFNTAVSDSTKEPGIVNMTKPQYTFNLGEASYLLWITEYSGTIMSTKDTHTIYSLSPRSIYEINGYVNED